MGRRNPKQPAPEPSTPIRPLTKARFAALDKILGPGKRYRIAKTACLHRRHVSRVIQGYNRASFEAMTRIADAAGIGLDDLRAYIATVRLKREQAEARREREATKMAIKATAKTTAAKTTAAKITATNEVAAS
jgi:hypothetical protein